MRADTFQIIETLAIGGVARSGDFQIADPTTSREAPFLRRARGRQVTASASHSSTEEIPLNPSDESSHTKSRNRVATVHREKAYWNLCRQKANQGQSRWIKPWIFHGPTGKAASMRHRIQSSCV